jgi:hypothetical protein
MATDSSGELTVDLYGRDVRPGTVSSREIADVIVAVEEMLVAIALRDDPDSQAEDLLVGLVSVSEGSLKLGFDSPKRRPVVAALGLVTAAVLSGNFTPLPNKSVDSLRVLSSFSKRHQGEVHLGAGSTEVPEAIVRPELVLPERALVRGTTTIHGRVIRVGGRRPRVMIETLSGATVYSDASPEIAKELAGQLYEMAAMDGTAVWDPDQWALEEFRIEEFRPYGTASHAETLEALTRELGPYYQDIDDVAGYVRSLRAGE